MELKLSSGSDDDPVASSEIPDIYYVSRFTPQRAWIPPQPKLTNIQKLKLVQKLLIDIKFVLSFEEDILAEQKVYWLFLSEIVCNDQRNKIKEELEAHCLTPIRWLSNSEIEITIDPSLRIIKKKSNTL